MTRNVGGIDKVLRLIVGVALLLFAITGVPATGYNWLGWIGIVPILTALVGFCPLYPILGLSTCPLEKKG